MKRGSGRVTHIDILIFCGQEAIRQSVSDIGTKTHRKNRMLGFRGTRQPLGSSGASDAGVWTASGDVAPFQRHFKSVVSKCDSRSIICLSGILLKHVVSGDQ